MKNISELEGEELSYYVALAWGWRCGYQDGDLKITKPDGSVCWGYRPDINGGQAMGLITAFSLFTGGYPDGSGYAIYRMKDGSYKSSKDESLFIAICRAVVASVYGDTVEGEL